MMARRVVGSGFQEFVADQLSGLRGATFRSMFGGYGIYQGTTFFGIVFKGRLYFKTSERTRRRYVSAGMGPFRPSAKQTLKNYYEVPAEVIEDADKLLAWAEQAAARS